MVDSPSYHEQQSWMLCALHATNNLLQERRFTKQNFDAIADELAQLSTAGSFYVFHPHRSTLKVGDYDANVIAYALNQDGFEMNWVDSRKDLDSVDWDSAFGIMVNKLTSSWMKLGLFSDRHWFSIRRFDNTYWNLDSQLNAPAVIGTTQQLKDFITKERKSSAELEIIIVNRASKSGGNPSQDE
eukprot:TRINITY_DN7984_c0_g1_i1.p1 TRINITY_DN7984_c0_g1~~TRINITY_DN7984_c0_g1_i1.p1  ORF type:complete len:185 (+),score=41.34 TRINITY_DN7984_c0_g1_i1:111-665(+)